MVGVRIFKYSTVANVWNQLGGTITGVESFGNSLSMSGDGLNVAGGATGNDDNGTNSGRIRIFKYASPTNTWNQVSGAIAGVVFY